MVCPSQSNLLVAITYLMRICCNCTHLIGVSCHFMGCLQELRLAHSTSCFVDWCPEVSKIISAPEVCQVRAVESKKPKDSHKSSASAQKGVCQIPICSYTPWALKEDWQDLCLFEILPIVSNHLAIRKGPEQIYFF